MYSSIRVFCLAALARLTGGGFIRALNGHSHRIGQKAAQPYSRSQTGRNKSSSDICSRLNGTFFTPRPAGFHWVRLGLCQGLSAGFLTSPSRSCRHPRAQSSWTDFPPRSRAGGPAGVMCHEEHRNIWHKP